jgi:hypothetical protein
MQVTYGPEESSDHSPHRGGREESAYRDFRPSRFAWKLASPHLFAQPVPFRGSLGLYDVPDIIIEHALLHVTG